MIGEGREGFLQDSEYEYIQLLIRREEGNRAVAALT